MPAAPIRLTDFSAIEPGVPVVVGPGVALPAETIPPLPGYVRLTTVTSRLSSLDLQLAGEAQLDTTRTAGGWNVIERPGKVALTTWTGGGPLRLTVPVTLNAVTVVNGDVGAGWRRLLDYWRPEDGDAPPVLRVSGHVAGTTKKWVIDEMELADDTYRVGGRLLRQSATLRLLQFIDVDLAKATKRRPGKGERLVIIKSRQGDTLKKIAKRELGDARQWRRIRNVNKKLKLPDKAIPKGTNITLPPRLKPGEKD